MSGMAAKFAGMVRARAKESMRLRGGGGERRWGPGTQERPNGYVLNRTPPPPGQRRKWEDWEAPYYITGVLAVLILGIGLNAKPDTTIETWAHKKALERLQLQEEEQQNQKQQQQQLRQITSAPAAAAQ